MRVVKTEVYNSETGEVLSSRESYGINNGNGWVVNYRAASLKLSLECNSAVTFRVFHLLISMQENYEDKGVICTRRYIQDTLKISRKSVYNALSWLIQNDYIIETERVGCTEFLFNPSCITIGREKDKRIRRWRALKDEFNRNEGYRRYGFDSPIYDSPCVAKQTIIESDTGELIIEKTVS